MAELPVGLWMIFFGFGLPLLLLVSTTLRFGLFWEAAREAADAACQAQYYVDPPNTTSSLGSVAVANNTANNVAALFPGISINSVNCYIVATSLTFSQNNSGTAQTSVITGPNTCLGSAADLTKNIYQVRVDVVGSIQPLLSIQGGPPLPGLNQPITITTSQLRLYENSQGLCLYPSGNTSPGGGGGTTNPPGGGGTTTPGGGGTTTSPGGGGTTTPGGGTRELQ